MSFLLVEGDERLLVFLVVEFLVSLESLKVVPGLLKQRHKEHKGQRRDVGEEEPWQRLGGRCHLPTLSEGIN